MHDVMLYMSCFSMYVFFLIILLTAQQIDSMKVLYSKSRSLRGGGIGASDAGGGNKRVGK